MRNLMSALAVLTLSAVGCKERAATEAPPSAQKQVELANEESAAAYERAKIAQERAADEAEEAARAQEKVADERADLMDQRAKLAEAETKAAQSAAEAEAAQEAARVEGEVAHAEAQGLNARAQQLQNQIAMENQVQVQTERVEVIDPATGKAVVTPDINDDYVDTEAEVERLRTQINAAIHRIIYGTEPSFESLDERIKRYKD